MNPPPDPFVLVILVQFGSWGSFINVFLCMTNSELLHSNKWQARGSRNTKWAQSIVCIVTYNFKSTSKSRLWIVNKWQGEKTSVVSCKNSTFQHSTFAFVLKQKKKTTVHLQKPFLPFSFMFDYEMTAAHLNTFSGFCFRKIKEPKGTRTI